MMAARMSQIDYDREMALVASDSGGHLCGVARIIADSENDTAEFAILVRSDMKGLGIGKGLLKRIIDHARHRGLHRVFGDILAENKRMLALARSHGFRLTYDNGSAGTVKATLDLG
jgi:acetyltransferase